MEFRDVPRQLGPDSTPAASHSSNDLGELLHALLASSPGPERRVHQTRSWMSPLCFSFKIELYMTVTYTEEIKEWEATRRRLPPSLTAEGPSGTTSGSPEHTWRVPKGFSLEHGRLLPSVGSRHCGDSVLCCKCFPGSGSFQMAGRVPST